MKMHLSFALAALTTLFAQPVLSAATTDKPVHSLRVRGFGDPLTFDWNRAYTFVEAAFVRNLQEGLVAIGPKMKVIPALASNWKISPDGKTYVFHLRKGVKWSDGAPMRAADFVAGWKRLLTPDFKANYAYLLFDLENAEDFHRGKINDFSQVGVKAINDFTLQVKLRAPIAYWIWIPTFWSTFPIRQDMLDKYGNGQWDKPGNMVNLGPYLLSTYEKGRSVTLKKNPLYYGKSGNVDTITAALVEDDITAVKLFESDQLDFVSRISSSDAIRLKGRADFVRWPEARVVHLDLNPNQTPTSNVDLRKAIVMAIDRNQLVKVVESIYKPATTLVTPGIMGYMKKFGLPYDPKAAKALVDKLAIKKPMTLDLVAVGVPDEVLVAKFIQKELLTNLGIDVKLHIYEPKQFYSPAVNFSGFTMLLNRWTADFLDPDNFFSIFLSSAGNNRVAWKNTHYDELVIKARSVTDAKEREALYTEAQKILIESEVIAMPMYYGENGALVRSNVSGFQGSPTNSYLFKDFSLKF